MMQHRTVSAIVGTVLALIAPTAVDAQSLVRCLDCMVAPFNALLGLPFFVEDWQPTNARELIGLNGPVKCVEERVHMLNQFDHEAGFEQILSATYEFTDNGDLTHRASDGVGPWMINRDFETRRERMASGQRRLVYEGHLSPANDAEAASVGGSMELSPRSLEFWFNEAGELDRLHETSPNPLAYRFRRDDNGRLVRVEVGPETSPDVVEFDESGRSELITSVANHPLGPDRRWFGREYVDWLYDRARSDRRAWIRFDERGTPIEWEFPLMGPWVRYEQHVVYDHHGNWIAMATTVSGVKANGTQVHNQLIWTCERRIEYAEPAPVAPAP
ncbi:MAG: hypothetical protein ACKVZJ_07190 [Phycisphaerales bacterium]